MKEAFGPIDAVVLWVDGSDPEWRSERFNQWKIYFNQCMASNADHRFANCDELVYCLRSLYYNTPWIRTVYLVTCGQKPKWLDLSHPRVKLVCHKEIMDRENLPTFNSCSIEMHLHRIPGLSDCFLYLNDDCFIAKRTTKRHFFNNSGKGYFHSHRVMQNPPTCNEINSFNWTIRNNQECLDKMFGKKVRYRPDHQAYLLYKSTFQYVEKHAPEYFKNTQKQKFRVDSTKGEKTLNAYIFATTGLELGHYELRLNADEQYYTVQQAKESSHLILTNTPMLLCINNAYTDSDRLFIHQLMSSLLPKPAPWEIPNVLPKSMPLQVNGKTTKKSQKSGKVLRPSEKLTQQSYQLYQPGIPKNQSRVIYQVKNDDRDKSEGRHPQAVPSSGKNQPVYSVDFYLPPKYVSTQVLKTRPHPTTVNRNKSNLYHHIGQYRDVRSLMSIRT
jgi:hypothetical protein